MTAIEPYATPLPSRPDEAEEVVRQLVMAWLLAQTSDHTRTAYRRDIAGDAPGMKVPGWLVWCAERGFEPLSIRRAHVDAHREDLRQARYSSSTISRRLAAISSFYQYVTDAEVLDHNYAKAAKRPRVDRSVSNATGLNEEELDLLLEEAEADSARSSALIKTLYFAGLRVGSVVAADVGDLGWSEGERRIRLTEKGGEAQYRPLEETVAEALDIYLSERGKPAKDEPLFLNDSEERIDQSFAWRLIRRLAKQAGIRSWDKLNPHSLRHSMATHALDADVPLAAVQDALGHQDPKTTRRYDLARQRRGKRPGRVLAERRKERIEKRQAGPPEALPDGPLPHQEESAT